MDLIPTLINTAADSLQHSHALDTERGRGQVELIIALAGLKPSDESDIIQAIDDRLASLEAARSYASSVARLTERITTRSPV